jgi:hypothetical protein
LSKRLRVFSTIIAALSYCVGNAGRLFVLAWFPCALDSVCRIALEWLIYGWPPRMPQWLIFNQLNPPTWLTPVVTAPFTAMAWAFVLSNICERRPDRGVVTAAGIRPGLIRFELSPAVLIAAGIFAATAVLDGLLRFAQPRLFIFVYYDLLEGSDTALGAWAYFALALRILVTSAVAAWASPIAAQVLLPGGFDRVPHLMRGNRLRLTAIFFLLTVALSQLGTFVDPVTSWIVRALVAQLAWTPREAAVRYAIDFPLDVLWTVVWPVTIGLVMKAAAAPAPERGTPRAA